MDTSVKEFVEILKYEEILVSVPGEVEYERSVATANLLYRYSRPHCVVQPKRSTQVQTIVKEAKRLGLPLTIKNGGHSYAGFSTAGEGISLDLSKMNTATLSQDETTITLQGGCVWGHAYKQLVNKKKVGYAINGGRCPTVGVSGFLLGGGLGPFTRSIGMGCDSLLEAKIVTADGELRTVSNKDDPNTDNGKLFWALRGGGGANFGVVVESKMPIQKLRDDEVVAGRFTWTPPLDSVESIMTKFYTSPWPNITTIDSSWLQEAKKDLQIRFLVYHNGPEKEFDDIVRTHIEDQHLRDQIIRRTLPEPSTRFLHETLVAQWSEEIVKAFPTNRTYTLYTSFVYKNDVATIEPVTKIVKEELAAFKAKFTGEEVLLQVTYIHSGGKANEVKPDATAFPWREGTYHSYIMMQWEEKYLEYDMREFLHTMKGKLRPYSLQKQALFINFADPTLNSTQYETAYYGENYKKLQEVKDKWDKSNFFNWSQGVKPTSTPAEAPIKEHNETDELAKKRFLEFEPQRLEGAVFQGLEGMAPVGGLSGVAKPIGLCDLGF